MTVIGKEEEQMPKGRKGVPECSVESCQRSNDARVCRPCKAAWHQERVRKSRAESVA